MGVSLDALKNRERALRLRRWGYATTGSLLISLLLVGLGLYAQVQVAVAERERARQDDARYKAEEIILYVNTKVSGKLPTAQAESMEVFKVLQRRVGEFYAEVGATNDEAEQRYRESVVLEHESNLALESFEFERSLELMSQAAEIREAIAGRPDAPPLWKLGLADTYASISGMHQYFDRRERAREFLEKAHAIRLALVESIGDPTRLWIYACINSFESLGVMMSQWGEHREAIEHFESADAWLQQLMKNDDEPDAWRGEQASIWSSLATAEIAAGEYSSAMPRLEKVLGIHEELQVLEPAIQEHAFRVAWTHLLLGDAARGARLRKTAMRRYDTAVELLVELSERDPDNFLWHRHVANAFEQRAWLQIDENDFAGARKDFQQARAGWWNSAKLLPSPGNWQMSIKKAESIGEQLVEGGIRADRDGRGTLAEAFVNEALETFAYGARAARHLVDRYPENELFWRDSEIAMELKAIDLLVAWGEPKLAEPRAVAALRFVTELSSREPHDPGWKKVRALCLSRLGRIAALNGELKSAIENHRKALSVLKDLRRADPVELTLQQLAADGCMRIMANLGSADPEQIETIAREVHEVLEDLQQHDAVLSWQQQRILLELNSRTHETGGGDD
jgi:tetratricopeptide (TPR) repeat protein